MADLLQPGEFTARMMAEQYGITRSAAEGTLFRMERDGQVMRVGKRRVTGERPQMAWKARKQKSAP